MLILPAIDLMDGSCVRLRQGRFDDRTDYDDDPTAVAERYAEAGATHLHIVDLEGAKEGHPRQTETIHQIVEAADLTCQVGGGIRSEEDVRRLLDVGVARVVIGSLAVRDVETTRQIFETFGPTRIVLAIDVRTRATATEVATEGWQAGSGQSADDVIRTYRSDGLETVLCTDIGKDGMLKGPNLELYRNLVTRHPDLAVLASGGVGSLEDLGPLRATGVSGVVIGKALYEGRFSLEEALAC